MGYREELRPASFRGVPFQVSRSDFQTGRRASEHVYPSRDLVFVEDLGRAARRYSVEAFVVGDDYLEKRDRLIEACEKAGVTSPGERSDRGGLLVHPYYGTLRVFCLRVRVVESPRDARMAAFVIEFVEVGDAPQPTTGTSPTGATDVAASASSDAAGEAFEDGVRVAGVTEKARKATSDAARRIGNKIRELDVFSGPAEDVRIIARTVSRLIEDASNLATAPADMVGTLRVAFDTILDSTSNAASALFAYEALLGIEAEQIAGTDPVADGQSDLDAQANADAMTSLAHTLAAGGAVRATARVEWDSYEEAIAARDRLAQSIDALAESGVTDKLFKALGDLRSTLTQQVPPPDEALPRLQSITLAAQIPALVLAYELYDDVGRDAEIVARNGVKHPSFLPAGVPLEVLTEVPA